MNALETEIDDLVGREYKEGFVTDIESDTLPPGLDEDVIRAVYSKKNAPKCMLDWSLEAYQRWQKMPIPQWAHVH